MKKVILLAGMTLLTCTACQKKQDSGQRRQDGTGRQPGSYGGQPQQEQTNVQRAQGQQKDRRSLFDSKNVKTYQGQIVQLINLNDPAGSGELVGVIIRTDRGTLPIILGPRCFVGGEQILSPGQQIDVNGVEVFQDGRVIIIALDATVSGHTIKLREQDGAPLWSAWKKKDSSTDSSKE